jgi:hypothetical protein
VGHGGHEGEGPRAGPRAGVPDLPGGHSGSRVRRVPRRPPLRRGAREGLVRREVWRAAGPRGSGDEVVPRPAPRRDLRRRGRRRSSSPGASVPSSSSGAALSCLPARPRTSHGPSRSWGSRSGSPGRHAASSVRPRRLSSATAGRRPCARPTSSFSPVSRAISASTTGGRSRGRQRSYR